MKTVTDAIAGGVGRVYRWSVLEEIFAAGFAKIGLRTEQKGQDMKLSFRVFPSDALPEGLENAVGVKTTISIAGQRFEGALTRAWLYDGWVCIEVEAPDLFEFHPSRHMGAAEPVSWQPGDDWTG